MPPWTCNIGERSTIVVDMEVDYSPKQQQSNGNQAKHWPFEARMGIDRRQTLVIHYRKKSSLHKDTRTDRFNHGF